MNRRIKFAAGVALAAAVAFWTAHDAGKPSARAAAAQTGHRADAASSENSPAAPDATAAPAGDPIPEAAGPVGDAWAAIPAGAFKQSLAALTPQARQRALAKLAKIGAPKEDYASLRAAPDGALFYVCVMPLPPKSQSAAQQKGGKGGKGGDQGSGAASPDGIPIANPPVRHSRPGSRNVLYLDFNGHTIVGTRWNSTFGVSSYAARPYDSDGDSTTFSPDEQAAIVQIWERVAEDYSPFDIDVTTEEPATFTTTTGRALITASTDVNGVALPNASDAAGVSFVDVFGDFDYATSGSPALIYFTSFGTDTSALAEAVAHELGHNLGLSHDGQTNGNEYYAGHGTGDTSWGPIMGAPYGRNVTQWSRGEYYRANNPQDDLAIIAAHTAYRPASSGATLTTATAAPVSGTALAIAGVLVGSADPDVYSFNTSATTLSLTASTYRAASGTNGGDADLKLELLDAKGSVVATDDPTAGTDALLSYKAKAGTYYVRLRAAATGSPTSSRPSGYTSYGSIGQYTVTGTIGAAAPAITSATSASVGGAQAFSYQIVATGSPTGYGATGLPAGLSLDAGSGLISGRPLATGVFTIGLRATNSAGTATATLTLTVTAAAPAIAEQTSGLQVVEPGGALALEVSALSASGAVNYAWSHNGRPVAGANGALLVLDAASQADGGFYQAMASNAVGATASAPMFVRVAPASTALVAWGSGSTLTAVPPNLTNPVAVVAGYSHALAVLRDGTVRGWGSNSVGETAIPAELASVVDVAAGYYDSLALKADGTLAAWGYNASGQTNVPAGLANVIAIAGGYAHFLALKMDGTVVAWGDNSYGQASVPAGLSGVVAIAAGRYHSLALKADGTVVAWGSGGSGQTAVPGGLGGVVAIAAGAEHSLALKADGMVVAWGNNAFGSITTGNGSVAGIAAGLYHSLARLADGSVVAWGYDTGGETAVPAGLDQVFAVAAGSYCSFALRDAAAPVSLTAPAISQQPVNATVNAGEAAGFSVSATGSPVLSFRWQISIDAGNAWTDLADNAFYTGTTTMSLTINDAPVALSGAMFRCLVTNAAGEASSNPATLTVAAANTPPAISVIGDQTILVDGASDALVFTVSDPETPAANLVVTAASSNSHVVPAGNLLLSGTGGERTLVVIPAKHRTGTATITLRVSDGALTASTSFNVTVVR